MPDATPMARPVQVLEMLPEEREELERRVRASTTSQRDLQRARIVLLRHEGLSQSKGGRAGGRQSAVCQPLVTALRCRGHRRPARPARPRAQSVPPGRAGRAGHCASRAATGGTGALEHAQHGPRGGGVGLHGGPDLAPQRPQAAPHEDVQTVERQGFRAQVLGCDRAVRGPAGEVGGALLRRGRRSARRWSAPSRGCRWATGIFARARTTTTAMARSACSQP